MAKTLKDFVTQAVGNSPQKFSGEPWFNAAGDCVHYHWVDDDFYRDWMDDKLTIYRSMTTHEAVGCEIKGIFALIKKLGEFGISVNTSKGVPVAMFLFVSHVAATPPEETEKMIVDREKMYRYIMGKIRDEKVSIPKDESAMVAT